MTPPIATVDAVLFVLDEGQLKTIVIERDKNPFKSILALPGGYFHTDEDDDALDAIQRVIRQKVGIKTLFLEQLFTISGRDRDPRGWSLSVVFLGIFSPNDLPPLPSNARLVPAQNLPELAFDHAKIIHGALERLKGKGAYSTLPAKLLEAPFTLGQLQRVYQLVLERPIEASAFRRKIDALGVLKTVPGKTSGRGRPGKLWALKEDVKTFDKRSLLPS